MYFTCFNCAISINPDFCAQGVFGNKENALHRIVRIEFEVASFDSGNSPRKCLFIYQFTCKAVKQTELRGAFPHARRSVFRCVELEASLQTCKSNT